MTSHLHRLSAGLRFSIYAALALLALLPFLVQPLACPFGLHDWGYACFREQASAVLVDSIAPLSGENLGGAQPLPGFAWPLLLYHLAASISPAISLRLVLVCSFLLGAIGADIAAARIFLVRSDFARVIAGIAYSSAPFLATKLVSGHLGFIIDLALLPFAVVAFDAIATCGPRAWPIAAFLAIGLFAQHQPALMFLAVLPVLAWRRVGMRWVLATWGIALCAWSPDVLSGLLAYRSGGLATEIQLPTWVRDESVPLLRVLDGTYYFAHYYDTAAPPLSVVAWRYLAPVFVAATLFVSGLSRRLAVCALGFGLLAAGLRGPLADPVDWLTAHVSGAALFRELYDLLAFVPLVAAGGAAIMCDALIRLSAVNRATALLAIILSCTVAGALVYPSASHGPASLIPFSTGSPWRAEIHHVANRLGADRVMWLPATVPLGPQGTPGGADPFSNTFGRHPSAQAYDAVGFLAYAISLGDHTGRLPPGLAQRLQVGETIVRNGVVSTRLTRAAYPVPERVRPSQDFSVDYTPTQPVAFATGPIPCEPALRSQMRDGVPYVRCSDELRTVALGAAAQSDNPHADWIPADRWAELDPALADPHEPVIFTLSGGPYRFLCGEKTPLLVYAPLGAVMDRLRIREPHWRWVSLRAGLHEIRGRRGQLVALSIASRLAPQSQGVSIERDVPVRANRFSGLYAFELPPHPAGIIVLRERWSPYWMATVDSAMLDAPVMADGYATGWYIPRSAAPMQVRIRYEPFAAYAAVGLLSLAVTWALLVASIIVARPRRS